MSTTEPDPPRPHTVHVERWTIGDATHRWFLARHGWSPLTHARYTRVLDRFTTDMGGPDIWLDQIRPIDFQQWVAELAPIKPTFLHGRDRQYLPSTLNTMVGPVRVFFAWATALQLIKRNPTLETPMSKVGRRLPKRLSRTDCERLLRVAEARERVQITLFLNLGPRLSEVARLQVEDWDRERDLLTILGKGDKVRILPIYGEVKRELAGWVDFVLNTSHGPMWPSPGRPDENITANAISTNLSRLGQRIGVHVHAHLLRHTALSDMVEEGLDLETVRHVAGHENLATLSVYTHASPDHVRRSLEGKRRPYGR